MTNGDILQRLYDGYPEIADKVKDYRPLCVDFVRGRIGITVWLENGDMLLYFPHLTFNEICGAEKKEGKEIEDG